MTAAAGHLIYSQRAHDGCSGTFNNILNVHMTAAAGHLINILNVHMTAAAGHLMHVENMIKCPAAAVMCTLRILLNVPLQPSCAR